MIRIRIASLNTLLIAAPFLLTLLYVPAYADNIKDAQELSKQGKYPEALDQINKFLNSHPQDARARFQKGIILTEQNKTLEAIKIFSDLTQDYPSLPEPYNNLAVLYFSQGQYDKAKNALEAAIRTHPTYATAHENLGDIYAKMASQAYDKALQLDKSNTTAQTKLALVTELFTPGTKVVRPASNRPDTSTAAPSVVALNAPKAPPASATAPVLTKPATAPAKPAPAITTPAIVARDTPLPVNAKPASSPLKPVEEVKHPAKQSEPGESPTKNRAEPSSSEVIKTLNAWAKAWSGKNSKSYLAFYGKDFKTPNGEKRSAWEQTRKERISAPKSIQVSITTPEVKFSDATHATVHFKQNYHSDTLQNATRKTMLLAKSGDKWLILEERVGH